MWFPSRLGTGEAFGGHLPPHPQLPSLLGFVLHASPPHWGMQLEFDLRSLHFEFITWPGPLASPHPWLFLEVLMRMGCGGVEA